MSFGFNKGLTKPNNERPISSILHGVSAHLRARVKLAPLAPFVRSLSHGLRHVAPFVV